MNKNKSFFKQTDQPVSFGATCIFCWGDFCWRLGPLGHLNLVAIRHLGGSAKRAFRLVCLAAMQIFWVCFPGDFSFSPFLRGLLGIMFYFFGVSQANPVMCFLQAFFRGLNHPN